MEDITFMITFFQKTWVLWWVLASLVVVRWFHGIPTVDPREVCDSPNHDDKRNDEYTMPGQLASRT
jgi:hypothetical protein